MATRLTQRDLRAVLRCLTSWDIQGGLQAFATSVTAALPALISADVTVFASADMRGRRLRAVENPHVTSPGDRDTYVRLSLERPHPMLSYFEATGDPEARRMTDFVSRRQFHRLPLYAEFYRKFGLESVMGVLLNNSPTAFDGFTLNRGRRDFDERDRGILTLLQPHLVEAYRTARAIDRLRVDLTLALRAIETPGFGLVVLAEGDRVRLLSPRAAAWLRTYFGPGRRGARLPGPLHRWIRHQHEGAADPSRLAWPRAPLVVDHDGARLIVRLVTITPHTLLLLEEQRTRRDPARLETLGLSSREAEVLEWVAEGKTTREIATILGLSSRTVQTYLERVFGKLGVETRAAAVARALRSEGSPESAGAHTGSPGNAPAGVRGSRRRPDQAPAAGPAGVA